MPITITIQADTLEEALALLKTHQTVLETPQRIQTATQEAKAVIKDAEVLAAKTETAKTQESAPSSPEKVENTPTAVKEDPKPAPSVTEVKGPDLSDVVVFRSEIKRIAVPLMNDEEKALPPKEGEMALVKRLFANSGAKNSQSVEVSKRQAFLTAIPGWLK